LTTAKAGSTQARTLDLLRFFERSASSISPPLCTRWLVKSLASGAFDSISAFWLA
jgi:hypothetical protein